MAADGTITIDTNIDTKGIETSTSKIRKNLKGIQNASKEAGKTISKSYEQAFESADEKIASILNDTEKTAKSKAASIAAVYRKAGYSQEEAFKKAWSQIERDSASGSKKVKKEIKGIHREAKNASDGMKSSFANGFSGMGSIIRRIGGIIAAAFAIKKVVGFGKECLELGSDLQEVQNVVDSVFTTMSNKVDEFAENAAVSAGLSETMAKRYAGTFGAMAKSFGFTEASALDMATALTQLSGDVASFYNISQDEAYTKLKSVFTGETESLKELGVVMTQTALDEYAMANGFGKTTSAMTEQEKVALRYRFVMDQLSTASGDFIRTSDGWANQVRILKLQIDSIKATIGQGLINLFTPVIKVINLLLAKLATVANAFKSFTELITGKKSSGATGAGQAGIVQDTLPDMGTEYNSAADGADNLAKSTKKAADATKDAGKAAKGYLSPLDEINKLGAEENTADSLTPDTGSTGTSGMGAGNVDYGKLAEGENVLEKTSGILDKIIKKMKQLAGLTKKGFWDGLGDYKPVLKGIQEDLKSIGKSMKDIFTSPDVLKAADNFAKTFSYALGQVAGSFASIGLTIARNIVGGIEKFLSQSKGRIKKYLVDMFDIASEISKIIGDFSDAFAEVFSVFGNETAQQITGEIIGIFAEIKMMISENAAKLGRDILNMITIPFIENKDTIKQAIEGTLEAIEPFTAGLLTAVQTVRDAIGKLYDERLKPFFDSVAEGLSKIVKTLIEGYNTYIVPVLQGLGERFQNLMEGPLGQAIENIQTFLGKLIDALKLLWEQLLVPFIDWIVKNMIPVIADIVDFIGNNALDVLETIIKGVGDVADVLSGIIDFLVGVFTGDWDLAWQGIREIFDGALNFIRDTTGIDFRGIAKTIADKMKEIKEKISGVWDNLSTFVPEKIEIIRKAIEDKFNTARDTVKEAFEKIVDFIKAPINEAIGLVNEAIGWINDKIGGIEKSFTFSYDFKNPITGTRYSGSYGMNLPRVDTVPYLARGAVIPPQSEFLAVLGDQKHGTNIEAPLSTIEQAVRNVVEESGSGKIHVSAEVAGRTLLDIIIDEAELRRARNGKNPFALGGV